jgi:hypothetical protein
LLQIRSNVRIDDIAWRRWTPPGSRRLPAEHAQAAATTVAHRSAPSWRRSFRDGKQCPVATAHTEQAVATRSASRYADAGNVACVPRPPTHPIHGRNTARRRLRPRVRHLALATTPYNVAANTATVEFPAATAPGARWAGRDQIF